MTTIRTLADLDHHLDHHGITATLTDNGHIHLDTDHPPNHIRDWIAAHRDLVLDWLTFHCVACGLDAIVFDTAANPWCETHMPITDPAIRAAIGPSTGFRYCRSCQADQHRQQAERRREARNAS